MAFLETVAVLGAAKFGQKVLESVAGTVAQKVAKGVTDQLSKPFEVTPIEKAIAASFRKAEEEVDLFYPAEQGRVEGFLKDFFSKEWVVQELQKPLKNQGERNPDVALLVKGFETALKDDKKVNDFTKALKKDERSNEYTVVDKSLIESWIRAFVKTYLKQTPANLEFETCKEDYFKQLKSGKNDVAELFCGDVGTKAGGFPNFRFLSRTPGRSPPCPP